MRFRNVGRWVLASVVLGGALFALQALVVDAHAAAGKKCPRGVRSCSAAQAGQPCDPNNPGVVCSAQADGSYCCLAYAP